MYINILARCIKSACSNLLIIDRNFIQKKYLIEWYSNRCSIYPIEMAFRYLYRNG
jgi:hypothetical protein